MPISTSSCATNTYEVGNPGFKEEQSFNLDIAARWKSGANTFSLGAFINRFRNYLSLEASGLSRDADGNGAGVGVTDDGTGNSVESGGTSEVLPEFAYRQVRARFRGVEASGNLRLIDSAQTLDLELRGDLVQAVNLTTGQNLPRIAPVRVGATLFWATGPWGARIGFDHAFRQNDVPVGDLTTKSYTLFNAALTYRQKVGASDRLWFARLDNIADRLAYSASSVLTQTVAGKSPMPGRTFKVGVQASF